MPLKFEVLKFDSITEATIKTILDNAAIDHSDNGGLYIESFPLNFWMDLDQKRKLLVM